MTENDFRRIALALPEATESSHMGHADFRVKGKIFATLGYPEEGWAMVKLTADQQDAFVGAEPEAFKPVKGAWGKRGCTNAWLKATKGPMMKEALQAAWSNINAKARSRKKKS